MHPQLLSFSDSANPVGFWGSSLEHVLDVSPQYASYQIIISVKEDRHLKAQRSHDKSLQGAKCMTGTGCLFEF